MINDDLAYPPPKAFATTLCLVSLAASLASTGCKKEVQVDATQVLTQSFQAAEPEAKLAIERVNAGLQTGNVQEAARALAPVVASGNLSQQQKQAIGVALRQINQAIAANPALDTKELYELRARMFQAVHSGPGF